MSALNPGGQYQYVTLQSAAGATGNGTALNVTATNGGSGATLGLQVSGTFTGTVTFEGTVDGSTWAGVAARSTGTTDTLVASATAAGLFRVDVRGLLQFRARVSAYTDGNVTVTALLNMAS